jgi:hypothetical protein
MCGGVQCQQLISLSAGHPATGLCLSQFNLIHTFRRSVSKISPIVASSRVSVHNNTQYTVRVFPTPSSNGTLITQSVSPLSMITVLYAGVSLS